VDRTVGDEIFKATARLRETGIDSPQLDAQLLLAHALNCTRLDVITHPERELSEPQWRIFREYVEKRTQRYPLAYITGSKEFFGLSFEVSPAVLIPRPETEILVEECLKRVGDAPLIADIGTGSGAIAVSLAVNSPNARIWATDISEDALAVARSNARKHSVAERVNMVQGDLLAPILALNLTFDAVVSNPPYIARRVIESLDPEVRCEPMQALTDSADGLEIIRLLFNQAREVTRLLLIEIGIGQAEDVAKIARGAGWNEIEFVRDLAGIERVAIAYR
jgi:release factor glutamine methyltransferase